MPRKSRAKSKAEPVAVAETLDAVIEKAGLTTADKLPAQLPPPEPVLERLSRAEAEPPAKELVEPIPDIARPRPSHDRNGQDHPLPSFVARVRAERPQFLPVPEDYKNVARYESAGVRVNKGIDDKNRGTAALQFAEDRPLSRATEYDLMEQVQKAGFQFKPATRQWERPKPEGMAPGENVIDGVRLAREIADARGVERGR